MSAKPGMFVELLDFSVPVLVGNEFDLAALVFFLAFGGGDDGEEFPVGVVYGIFKFTLKAVATRVGVPMLRGVAVAKLRTVNIREFANSPWTC